MNATELTFEIAMTKQFTQEDVLAVIQREVASSSLRKTAQRAGVSAVFLGDVLRGNRGVSDTIAAAFGFNREVVVVFRKKAA